MDAHRLSPPLPRRAFLAALLGGSVTPLLASDEVEALLRAGGAVITFRHALAPGTFDPPGFRLGDCSTQRNLGDEGRAQARRIGQWFAERALRPARVRSSPWCRCLDTAQLAFGQAEPWPALGSPHGAAQTQRVEALRSLRQALVQVSRSPGRFEAWITHMFVIAALTGEDSRSGEGLVLRASAGGALEVRGRLRVD